MLFRSDHGAKVIHPKAVEIAKRGNVPLVIKNTMSECKGTVIKSNVSEEEKRLISGITHLNNRIQVRVRLSENRDSKLVQQRDKNLRPKRKFRSQILVSRP